MLGHSALGQSALGQSGVITKQLVAAAGALTLTGYNVTIRASFYTLDAAPGSFAIAAVPVIFKPQKIFPVAGAFALAGNPAVMAHIRTLTAQFGTFAIAGSPVASAAVAVYLQDALNFRTTVVVSMVVPLPGGGLGAHDSISYVWKAGALISDVLKFADDLDLNTIVYWQGLLTDVVRMQDMFVNGVPMALTDNVGFNEVLKAIQSAHVIDKWLLSDDLSANATYLLALLDGARYGDTLTRFLGGTLTDVMTASDLIAPVYRPYSALTDTAFYHDDIEPKLLLRIGLADEVSFTDAALLNMLFQGDLVDGVNFSVAYISPGGGFTAWALNVTTNAVSEYTNWVFNSFAQMGKFKYLGANERGIYELQGPRDETTDIIAQIKSGLMQLNGPMLHGFSAVYIGMRGSGQYVLKIATGDGREYVYGVTANASMLTTKVDVGKGLRARYFSFELIGTGDDFDLESIEFVPMRATRRV